MKRCPFCAEDIQPAAIVCKHCRRDLGAAERDGPRAWGGAIRFDASGTSTALTKPAQSGGRLAQMAKATGTAFVLTVAVAYMQARTNSGTMTALSVAGSLAPPTVVRVADADAQEIQAGHFVSWTWHVADSRPCLLTGHVSGLAGGRKDVQALVMTADQFTNMSNRLNVTPIYGSEQVSALTLRIPLPGPGDYAFVLSNAFSILTDKTVQVRDVRVTCG